MLVLCSSCYFPLYYWYRSNFPNFFDRSFCGGDRLLNRCRPNTDDVMAAANPILFHLHSLTISTLNSHFPLEPRFRKFLVISTSFPEFPGNDLAKSGNYKGVFSTLKENSKVENTLLGKWCRDLQTLFEDIKVEIVATFALNLQYSPATTPSHEKKAKKRSPPMQPETPETKGQVLLLHLRIARA